MYWNKERLTEVMNTSEEVILYLESGRSVRGILSEVEDFYVVIASEEPSGLLYHKILIEQIDFPTQVVKVTKLKKVRGKIDANSNK